MGSVLHCDCAVIGGGIAGLWLSVRLHRAGYKVMLIEADQLGGGQTLCSQGIIHGGVKYSLSGTLSGATQAISAMPERWRHCLQGTGELDLRQVQILSEQQYLLTTDSAGSRLSGFFASRALHSHIQPLQSENYPAAVQNSLFKGRVYRLHEPVLAVDSVLHALLVQLPAACVVHGIAQLNDANTLAVHNGQQVLMLRAQQLIWTAGAGIAALAPEAQQTRPLHMVLARGNKLPELYAHCLGLSDKPRLTITTHRDQQGRRVWYIGGALAENGIELERAEQIERARAEFQAVFPWLNWRAIQFATLRVDRAEGRQLGNRRPDLPVLRQHQGMLLAWPTKLALTPLLADRVLEALQTRGITPQGHESNNTKAWQPAAVADYPWDRAIAWN